MDLRWSLMSAIRVHAAEARMLVAQWPTVVSDEDVESFFESLDRRVESFVGSRWGLIHEIPGVAGLTATQRRFAAADVERRRSRDEGRLCGVAIVTKSVMARGVATAVFWLSPPYYPIETFAHVTEALRWLRERIDP